MSHCPTCSAEVPPKSRFCGSCGSAVDASGSGLTQTVPSRASAPSSLDQGRFTTGALLAGRYRIVGLLGRGGMGEVYRAEDLKLGQPVALKFLPLAMEKDDSRLARLVNEVRLARQVSHPNVCRVYDIDEVDGSHFMAMEYVDGEDLASLLRRIGRLPHEKALEISRQICAGLAAAHEQGILHRDLKPANVMIDGRGRVKLADFGLANLAAGISGDDARSGTPAYMAPEQLAGREVTVRSDLFALGLVLHEVFTGHQIFSGKSVDQIREMHRQSITTTAATRGGNVDAAVEQVILRCLEKEPLARPASALAVAAALPGGNALAAALAAGQTPSPEMVADAGTAGGLRPLVAIAALAAVVLALVLSIHNAGHSSLLARMPFAVPPVELAADALGILDEIGAPKPGQHQRYGFAKDEQVLKWLDDQEAAVRHEALQSGRPAGARFWFRYSATELEPDDVHAFFVEMDDPAQVEPDQGRIWLDTHGRLVGLDRLPAREMSGSGRVPDWDLLFTKAGLTLGDFTPTEPVRAPITPCAGLNAWRGPLGGGVEGVVQAGGVDGVPTYFEIIGPWIAVEAPGQEGPAIIGYILAALVITALVMARRNLINGRSDTKGALKLVTFFVLTIFGTWFLVEVRLGTFDAGPLFTQMAFGRLCAHGLSHGVLFGLFYIALEPYVRRMWPETLVSWSRLLIGRVRDPLVGRDLLVGMAVLGLLSASLTWLGALLMRWSGAPQPLSGSKLDPSVWGIRYALSELGIRAESSIGLAMVFLVFLLILRLVLRRNWAAFLVVAAVPAMMVVFSPLQAGLPTWLVWLSVGGLALIQVALITCLLRFGLVSLIGGLFTITAMNSASLTWDFQQWYAGSGLVIMLVVLGMAVWAFTASLAGRQLFKDSLLD